MQQPTACIYKYIKKDVFTYEQKQTVILLPLC